MVHLQERLLNQVFGRGRVPHVSHEKRVQLRTVSLDERRETGIISRDVPGQEFFVRGEFPCIVSSLHVVTALCTKRDSAGFAGWGVFLPPDNVRSAIYA